TTLANEIKALFRKDNKFTGAVTFQEFVNYVVTRSNEHLDVHWKPMFQLCDPCNIHYDILGKYETLEEDANHTLNRIGVPEIVHYPDTQLNHTLLFIYASYYALLQIKVSGSIHCI
ncbi:Carbohydrate sulfotransferase 14, partial [Ophiophagus hannah]